MPELWLLIMILMMCAGLVSGFPVAFVLSGVALLFALVGSFFGVFDLAFISAFPDRIYGIMTNPLLVAVPLFVFMGVMLEKAKIAEELLETLTELLGRLRGGMGLSVIAVGALLAASTGIVGATVVTMGLISLPCMLKARYCPSVATGVICASGTLGQIIPPSIVLILLGDQISSAHQTAQMSLGNFSAEPVSIADLFMGALLPGLTLVLLYGIWLVIYSLIYPERVPETQQKRGADIGIRSVKVLLPPLLLIFIVLGSILTGVATATESASVGAVGAIILAATHKRLTWGSLTEVTRETTRVTSMLFTILIGAALFTLVFRGFNGEELVQHFLQNLPGGLFMAMLVTMLVMFFLGFFLDFIEIIFVVVPIIAPILLMMGADPIWLAIMIAVNLQTSFLTPPFGFALFYLRGVAPKHIKTTQIYKGVVPFVMIQLFMLAMLAAVPELATWLPEAVYGTAEVTAAETPEFLESESFTTDYGVDF